MFFTQGMIYMVVLMMFQSAIDYQEWKFGERKEAVAFAWRPLDVKFSSALLRGLQFLIFAVAGVSGYFTAVSNAEGTYDTAVNTISAELTAEEIQAAKIEAAATRNTAIFEAWQEVERWQLVVYGAITVGIILAAMVAVLFLLRRKFIIDEKLAQQITAELEQRHLENEAKEEAEEAEAEVVSPETSE